MYSKIGKACEQAGVDVISGHVMHSGAADFRMIRLASNIWLAFFGVRHMMAVAGRTGVFKGKTVVKAVRYEDKARKFTVHQLLHYWCTAAYEEWPSYHTGADRASISGLPEVHYFRFSSKAAEVPFAVFKELLHLLIRNSFGKPSGNWLSRRNCCSSTPPRRW